VITGAFAATGAITERAAVGRAWEPTATTVAAARDAVLAVLAAIGETDACGAANAVLPNRPSRPMAHVKVVRFVMRSSCIAARGRHEWKEAGERVQHLHLRVIIPIVVHFAACHNGPAMAPLRRRAVPRVETMRDHPKAYKGFALN
jgi:hypothetical protein